jgi:hypothetical protein
MAGQASYRVGVDIGSTFTDILLVGPEGTLFAQKVPSTPELSMGLRPRKLRRRAPPFDATNEPLLYVPGMSLCLWEEAFAVRAFLRPPLVVGAPVVVVEQRLFQVGDERERPQARFEWRTPDPFTNVLHRLDERLSPVTARGTSMAYFSVCVMDNPAMSLSCLGLTSASHTISLFRNTVAQPGSDQVRGRPQRARFRD